ncbi:hypothetical protein TYRP_023650 [Tyrophagus putrescentiae]|nr:hypothetical protein TYRP_023650 [Tyrophagus putrescentiae]
MPSIVSWSDVWSQTNAGAKAAMRQGRLPFDSTSQSQTQQQQFALTQTSGLPCTSTPRTGRLLDSTFIR